jgi:MYXO-CTERM domain-containing protein
VSFTSPASGASLSGTVTVSFTTTNTTASSSLQAQLDSNMLGQATGTSFTKTWDTTTAPNGTHNLVGTAIEGGFTGTASLPVTIANPVTVTITSPGAGATVSGNVSVTATARATAAAAVTKIEVYADNILAGSAPSSPATVIFDASLLGVGSHTLTAKGYDSAGATGTSAPVQITVQSGSQGGPDAGSSSGADGGGNTVLKGQGCGCGATGASAPWALLLLGVALAKLRISSSAGRPRA